MRIVPALPVLAVAAIALAVIATTSFAAGEAGPELLAPIEQARAQAESAEAALLAPQSYGAGIAAFERAQRAYAAGAGIDDVRGLAAQASGQFERAARHAAEARKSFAAALQARARATGAEALRLDTATFARADNQLRAAAVRLEGGDARVALTRAEEAARLYDTAELQALKAAVLTPARARIARLQQSGAARLAPRMSARARELLAEAEGVLDADRTDIARATEQAAAAVAAADNATALGDLVREARERNATLEDLLIEWQESIQQAASAAQVPVDPGSGPRAGAGTLATQVGELQARAARQALELAERDRQVAALEEEIRELDLQLTQVGREARSSGMRLAERERATEQLRALEALFSPEEALVLRQGNSLIVRLRGLGFPPGSARIGALDADLMSRVGRAAALYPGAALAVEGHTDTSGNSAANQRLSQARAEAVRDHLTQRLQIPAGRITALGHGDTRPVASNETEQGRRENRRIDLVITPRGALP